MTKARLVIVIGPYELHDSLAAELKASGVFGLTVMRVDGHGAHGPRHYGLFDGANVRFEIIANATVAARILELVADRYKGRGVVAYGLDVDAVGHAR